MPEEPKKYDDLILYFDEVAGLCQDLNLPPPEMQIMHDIACKVADQMFFMCDILDDEFPTDDNFHEKMQAIDIQATVLLARLRVIIAVPSIAIEEILKTKKIKTKKITDSDQITEKTNQFIEEIELIKKPKYLRTLIPAIVYVAAKIAIDDAYTYGEIINAIKNKFPPTEQTTQQSQEFPIPRIRPDLVSFNDISKDIEITPRRILRMEHFLLINIPGSLINTKDEIEQLLTRGQQKLDEINAELAAEHETESESLMSPSTASTSVSASPSVSPRPADPPKPKLGG